MRFGAKRIPRIFAVHEVDKEKEQKSDLRGKVEIKLSVDKVSFLALEGAKIG